MSSRSEAITFVLFTFNEEKRIERAILNFKNAGEILVVDNESTDRTCEIALQYGCDILINKNSGWVEDEVTTARVKAQVTTDWIYWGFADEMVDEQTLETIVQTVHSGRWDIINIARKNYYYGQFCYDLFADRMNRIFRKECIDFTGNKIHCMGKAVPGSRICKFPPERFVHHFISNTAKSYLQAMDRYTDIESTEDRPVPTKLRLVGSAIKTVFLQLVYHRGYKGGMPAYFLVCQMVYYRWLSAMKIYEMNLAINRDAIESKNDSVRDQILQSLK
ncbi:MAG TPA: glycosyltransferase [Acidobacteriaceae bacterium]|nr:glycosyltransferase [Acidobacteriaceae bacterium]